MSRYPAKVLAIALSLAACGVVGVASGQARRIQDRSAAGESRVRVHPPADRVLSRGMRRAEESIAKGEFVQSLRFLDEVLARDEDYFVEAGAQGAFTGMKELARRLIRDMPPDGRRAYQAEYGPVAERWLRNAVATGDMPGLQRVVERYFYTTAGYQAALLLAAEEADAGRHLSAALLYQQLLDTPEAARLFDPTLTVRAAASWQAAGDAARAGGLLEAVVRGASRTVRIGGGDYRLDEELADDPLQWLRTMVGAPADLDAAPQRHWLTYRGNAARNGAADGGLPHMRVRWKVRLMYGKLEQLFQEYESQLQQSGTIAPVASMPLAAGDYVLVRTPHELLAVDFRTGKRVWRSELQRDPQLEQLMRSGGAAADDAANAEPARAFARRMWLDYMYGLTSSDGARVYAIRDLPMPSAHEYDMSPLMAMGALDATEAANRLSAYDLATEGRLVWEIDGAAVAEGLSGAFFLGAPLTVGSSLYVLMEIRDDVYLAALDAASGRLLWRQQLANLEAGISIDLQRRLQCAVPSYDAGMLVCPTGAGLVVGVDLAKRSLAWAYQFDEIPGPEAVYGGMEQAGLGVAARWTDAATAIADGRVLLTPPESSEIHCLELRTGRLLWKRPRGDMLRLACIHQGVALLTGNRALTALRLDDGQPAWSTPERALPRGAAPAGAGFLTDGKYFLPLTNAEVAAIDIENGSIVSRVRSRDGTVLGNLICHRGAIVSQNGLFLDCFDQVEALRRRSTERLADNPDDPEALRSLGEIAFNEGRLSEAIDLVERAYRADPRELETRDVLAECLIDALNNDFAAYRTRLPLLKDLEGSGPRGLEILRIEAQGLLNAGDRLGSAAACVAMYRQAADDQWLSPSRNCQTTAARWVMAQIADVWDAASADERAAIRRQLDEEAAAIGGDDQIEGEARFLRFFGALEQFDSMKLSYARRLEEADRIFEAQQILLDLEIANNREIRSEAVARLSAQLHAAGLHTQAREYDRELAGPLADQACLDGKTGSELARRWNEAAPDAYIAWPQGKVEAAEETTPTAGAATRMRSIAWSIRLEHADPILGSGVGFVTLRGGGISWQDRYGREFFNTPFEPDLQNQYPQAGCVSGSTRGSLLLVSLGREAAAFNTLPGAKGQVPATLWRVNLGSTIEQESYFEESRVRGQRRPGSHRPPRALVDGKWQGTIGPMSSAGCILQDQRRLMCIEPSSGEILWSRSDAAPGCDLFGDGRYVFAVPPRAGKAQVYGAIDGRRLGDVDVPPWLERLTTRGRTIVRWGRNENGRRELAATDAWTGDVAWRHEFHADAEVDVDVDRHVAVVEPQGRAVVVDAADGAVLVDQAIEPETSVEAVHVASGDQGVMVIVQRPPNRNTRRIVRAFNQGDSPVIDGRLYMFDLRTGVMRWARPAEISQDALVQNVAADLPFIVFAGSSHSTDRGGASATSVHVVDKASGRTLYSNDQLPQSGLGYCVARASDRSIAEAAVETANRTIVLKFTEGRRPPEPPAMAEVESGADKSSGGVLRIILNLGGGG